MSDYNDMTLWDTVPEWWQRRETLRALRRNLTENEWIEFCELDAIPPAAFETENGTVIYI